MPATSTPGVVVVAQRRHGQPVAGEHERHVRRVRPMATVGVVVGRSRQRVVARAERQRDALARPARSSDDCRGRRSARLQLERLEPGPVVAARLQAGVLELPARCSRRRARARASRCRALSARPTTRNLMCASSASGSMSGARAAATRRRGATRDGEDELAHRSILRGRAEGASVPRCARCRCWCRLRSDAGTWIRHRGRSRAGRARGCSGSAPARGRCRLVDSRHGSAPTRSRTPNSPPSTVSTLNARRDDVTSASATRAAARPSAYGPGGHRRAARASRRVELHLRQHALERVTADRRFAPGHDEARARRSAEHGEGHLRGRAARLHRDDRRDRGGQRFRRRADERARARSLLRARPPAAARPARRRRRRSARRRRNAVESRSSSPGLRRPATRPPAGRRESAMTHTAQPVTRVRSSVPSTRV